MVWIAYQRKRTAEEEDIKEWEKTVKVPTWKINVFKVGVLTFSGKARPSGSPGPAVPLDIIYILPSNRFRLQARLNWTRPGLAPAANMWEVLAL